MKKLFLTITVILSLLLGLISCGGLGSEYNYNCLENSNTHINIKASINGAIENSESRSVTPDTSLTVYSNYTYYLATKNLHNGSHYVNPEPIDFYADFSNGKTGTIDMDLTPGYYEFTLFALRTPLAAGFSLYTLQTNAILVGSSEVDLRTKQSNQTPNISFSLKPNEVSLPGRVELYFYTTPDWTFDSSKYMVEAAMYDSNNSIYGTNGTTAIYDIPQSTPPASPQYQTTIAGGVLAGLYDFELVFTKISDATKKYTYLTSVYVLPGTNTIASVAIPNVIEYEPDAPSNFRASYKDPENNLNSYYIVDLSWDDNSNNEYYFQLELLKLNQQSDPASLGAPNTPWGTSYYTAIRSSNVTTYGTNFQASNIYYNGSLMANNTTVQIKLELGEVYIARICAVNDAGQSTYAYLDFTNGGTGNAEYTDFATDSKALSRYRVTYNPVGGEWTLANGTIANQEVIEYHSLGNTSIIQSFPTTQYTSLIKGITNWSGWKKDSIAGTDYTSTTYKGFANLSLFAVY